MKARRAIFEIYLDYIQYYGGSIRVRSLLDLCKELGFSGVAIRAALCRLSQQGWLDRTRENKQSFYALTAMGRDRVEEAAPRIFTPLTEKWDGQWTILTYSLPERLRAQRERLRRELIWLGYGPLTPATWIIPKPAAELTTKHLLARSLDKGVHLFRARHINSLANAELVKNCWDLAAVQKQYRSFIDRWNPQWRSYQQKFNSGKPVPDNLCFSAKMRLLHEYGRFLYLDPRLPWELLPKDWLAEPAWRIFRDCYHLLAEGALRYFENGFQGPARSETQKREGHARVIQGLMELV